MRTLSPRWARRLALAATIPAAGCIEGPFEHANPFDPSANFTVQLVAYTDTVWAVGDEALFQVVTTPVLDNFAAEWTSTASLYIENLGDGRFRVVQLPPSPVAVQVHGGFGSRRAVGSFVVMPK